MLHRKSSNVYAIRSLVVQHAWVRRCVVLHVWSVVCHSAAVKHARMSQSNTPAVTLADIEELDDVLERLQRRQAQIALERLHLRAQLRSREVNRPLPAPCSQRPARDDQEAEDPAPRPLSAGVAESKVDHRASHGSRRGPTSVGAGIAAVRAARHHAHAGSARVGVRDTAGGDATVGHSRGSGPQIGHGPRLSHQPALAIRAGSGAGIPFAGSAPVVTSAIVTGLGHNTAVQEVHRPSSASLYQPALLHLVPRPVEAPSLPVKPEPASRPASAPHATASSCTVELSPAVVLAEPHKTAFKPSGEAASRLQEVEARLAQLRPISAPRR